MPDKNETNQGTNAITICPVCKKPLTYAPENLVDRRSYYYCDDCGWYREETGQE